jgi:hypothetical protein
MKVGRGFEYFSLKIPHSLVLDLYNGVLGAKFDSALNGVMFNLSCRAKRGPYTGVVCIDKQKHGTYSGQMKALTAKL